MDKNKITIDTYNTNARKFADKFNNRDSQEEHIKMVFSYLKKDKPKIIDLGCGNGRDTELLMSYSTDYLGIDASEELIKLARIAHPSARYEAKDFIQFEFPRGTDLVFASASLIHVDRKTMKDMIDKIYHCLSSDGLLFMTLKYSEDYKEETREDKLGIRTFYLYNPELIKELAKDKYKVLHEDVYQFEVPGFPPDRWCKLLLQKRP